MNIKERWGIWSRKRKAFGCGVVGLLLTAIAVLVNPASVSVAAQQSQIPQQEYDALVALYESTDGANWHSYYVWKLPTSAPCALYGVTCAGGHVIRLSIPVITTSGTIPPELGNLTHLKMLGLGGPGGLTGPIPPELGSLSRLEVLYMPNQLLRGGIPPEFGNLTNLQELHLQGNLLSGPVPSELGNLTRLRILHLGLGHRGPLPRSLMNLSLEIFGFERHVCTPSDATFQAWLSSISSVYGPNMPCSDNYIPLIVRK